MFHLRKSDLRLRNHLSWLQSLAEVRRNVVVARSLADSEPLPTLTGVEPLVPPATLTVRQLETHAPEIQDIVLAPITISELSVDPLDRSQR